MFSSDVLWDIHEKCRLIEEIKLAEEIGDIICESGVFEDYQ